MQVIRRWMWTLPVLAMVGCAQHTRPPAPPPSSGQVSYRAVEKKDTRRYRTDKDVSWSRPHRSADNGAPVYPEALLGKHLPPVTVTALLIVDTRGHVTSVRITGENGANADTEAFDQAVREATLQWTFTPLVRSRWKTQPDGTSVRVGDRPMPFSQAYAFRFAVHDGKPQVSSGTAARPAD